MPAISEDGRTGGRKDRRLSVVLTLKHLDSLCRGRSALPRVRVYVNHDDEAPDRHLVCAQRDRQGHGGTGSATPPRPTDSRNRGWVGLALGYCRYHETHDFLIKIFTAALIGSVN